MNKYVCVFVNGELVSLVLRSLYLLCLSGHKGMRIATKSGHTINKIKKKKKKQNQHHHSFSFVSVNDRNEAKANYLPSAKKKREFMHNFKREEQNRIMNNALIGDRLQS